VSAMLRHIRRMLLLAITIAGCLVASAGAAQALISVNHCEPTRRMR
jgi:hypothetical protein